MKLIFNREIGSVKQGDIELNDLLGFLDKSFDYEDIERFIKNSTQDIINIIGKTTYEIIQGYYVGATTDEDQLALIEAVQYSIAIDAYRKYAPTKDVGHTQNGRRMRVDDHEKQAFEWMLDRDNENMERMFYQSLDQLLLALDGLTSWKDTDQYKKLNELFVCKTLDFDEFFNINNSRYLLIKLQPGLRQAERQGILPRIGKTVFDELKADRTSEPELQALIKEACVYWALSWAMKGRLTVTLFPEGVLQRFVSDRVTTQGKKPPLMNEYAWAAQQFMQDAEEVLLRIEESVAPEEELAEGEDPVIDPPFTFSETDNYIDT